MGHYYHYHFAGGHGGTAPTIQRFSASFRDFCETFLTRARQARPYKGGFSRIRRNGGYTTNYDCLRLSSLTDSNKQKLKQYETNNYNN